MEMAPYFVSALRNELGEDNFYRYFANARDGQGVVLTYSFLKSVPAGAINYYGDPNTGFRQYTAKEKAVVNDALAIFESVANVRFKETTGNTDLQFGQFAIPGNIAGYAGYPLYNKTTNEIVKGPNYGDVWLDSDYIAGNPHLVLHEVGHSLGLEHPFEGTFQLPAAEDNTNNTVMSYSGVWQQTLGIYDVIALQSIYGPAKRRMGDNTYVFGNDKLIWDGGGKDLITAAQASKAVTIDLHDGSWNFAGSKAASFLDDAKGIQVYLGNFTVIEKLIGSRFDDHLSGNQIANTISGGKGDDRIEGSGGRDALRGGNGADTFLFTKLSDSTAAMTGRDFISDFKHGQDDRFDLRALDADAGANNNQAFTFVGTDKFSNQAGELHYSDKGGDTLVTGDIDGDGTADFSFLVNGNINLVKGDFLL